MRESTELYIENVRNYLVAEYGAVKPEWEVMLQLLSDNLDEYSAVMESIAEYGVYDPETGKKNPLLTTSKDLRASIYKIVQHFGISPYAYAKIKKDAEDDTTDFIDNLTTNEE